MNKSHLPLLKKVTLKKGPSVRIVLEYILKYHYRGSLRMPVKKLAGILGLSITTVTTALKYLVREGILDAKIDVLDNPHRVVSYSFIGVKDEGSEAS